MKKGWGVSTGRRVRTVFGNGLAIKKCKVLTSGVGERGTANVTGRGNGARSKKLWREKTILKNRTERGKEEKTMYRMCTTGISLVND